MSNLGHAINVVLWLVILYRYATGWRLEWRKDDE